MAHGPTPRQRAREETLGRIKELALAQLAESSASELSLRAIARELNLVSSAIYRYYASRDELITALIIDAYDDLADALEAAGAPDRRQPRRRWLDVCEALRDWARAEPYRFALIYGSTIPGYRAPEDTIGPAGRVIIAFLQPAHRAASPPTSRRLPRGLRTQLAGVAAVLEIDDDPAALLGLTGSWGRALGLLTLELGGHLVGGFEPADDLYLTLMEVEADALGL